MKTPREVGQDFDEYARRWSKTQYGMEGGWDGQQLVVRDEDQDQLQHPGDEWGDLQGLVSLYGLLFDRLLPAGGDLNVIEIGAGGGRSTKAALDCLGERVKDYHVVDVSAAFLAVLEARIDRPVTTHVVSDVDLQALPTSYFQLCLAQSSWSHIGLYDQYRYLRDLRRVMDHQAPIVVNGQFQLGLGDDWTWNRFRRRVYQAEHGIEGVFHEFTSNSALVELLVRLEYDIEVVHNSGFVARRGQGNPDASVAKLDKALSYPYLPSLVDFARGAAPRIVSTV